MKCKLGEIDGFRGILRNLTEKRSSSGVGRTFHVSRTGLIFSFQHASRVARTRVSSYPLSFSNQETPHVRPPPRANDKGVKEQSHRGSPARGEVVNLRPLNDHKREPCPDIGGLLLKPHCAAPSLASGSILFVDNGIIPTQCCCI